jgi:hypothetical protein
MPLAPEPRSSSEVARTDGPELRLTRFTQPEPELKLLIRLLKLQLPLQPPP